MQFKVSIRPRPVRMDGTVNVKIRVCHERKTRYISTEYYVNPKYFDQKAGIIKAGGTFTQEQADRANARLQIKIGMMAEKAFSIRNRYDIKGVVDILRDAGSAEDFFAYIDKFIKKQKDLGNKNYMDTLKSTKSAVQKFTGTTYLPFNSITHSWLSQFETWLRIKGRTTNGIGVKMRDIRTIFNQAVASGIADLNSYPFRRYKIKKEATIKRNLSISELVTIKNIQIKDPLKRWARDMYMLSFYLIGINMKDLFYLKGIEDGRIKYIRSKGKRPYSVKVFPQAQEIIDRYRGKLYLIDTLEKYSDYRYATKRINTELKELAKEYKINKKITTYYARHTWATIASQIGVSKDIISYALGHTIGSEITAIYIDFNLSLVDQANQMLLSYLESYNN